jgi:hypothetical protein
MERLRSTWLLNQTLPKYASDVFVVRDTEVSFAKAGYDCATEMDQTVPSRSLANLYVLIDRIGW